MLIDGYAPLKKSALRTLYVRETYAPINRINLTAEQLVEFHQLKKLTPVQINKIINIIYDLV